MRCLEQAAWRRVFQFLGPVPSLPVRKWVDGRRGKFNNTINVPFSSPPFMAAIMAYFHDNTLHQRDSSVRKDRGKHWWDEFRSFKGDKRSEGFSSLPFNLNNYFLSV
ncbi:hypothetical protein Droror1_Dr00021081 [Drosera rotundifolia]